jgi:hypothetical protein
MSAFLKYSQTRRSVVKQQNPDMSNTDVSRLLGEMWRSAPDKEKRPYVEIEERERAVYKQETGAFKAQQARLDAASRTPHASIPIPTENSGLGRSSNRPGAYFETSAYHQESSIYRQNQRVYHHQDASIYRQEPNVYQHDHHHRHHNNVMHQPYPIHYGYSFNQGKSN